MPQSQLIAKYTELYFSTLLPQGQQHLVVCCLHLPGLQENDRQEAFALSQMLLFHKLSSLNWEWRSTFVHQGVSKLSKSGVRRRIVNLLVNVKYFDCIFCVIKNLPADFKTLSLNLLLPISSGKECMGSSLPWLHAQCVPLLSSSSKGKAQVRAWVWLFYFLSPFPSL